MPEYLIYSELAGEGVRLSRSHLKRLEGLGEFLRRVQISARRIGWVKTEVQNWVKARLDQRDSPPRKGRKR